MFGRMKNVQRMVLVAVILVWMTGMVRMDYLSFLGCAGVGSSGSGLTSTCGGLGNNLGELRIVPGGDGHGDLGSDVGNNLGEMRIVPGGDGQSGLGSDFVYGGGMEIARQSTLRSPGTRVQNFLAGKFVTVWQIWPFSKNFPTWANGVDVADVGEVASHPGCLVALGGHLGHAGRVLASLILSRPNSLRHTLSEIIPGWGGHNCDQKGLSWLAERGCAGNVPAESILFFLFHSYSAHFSLPLAIVTASLLVHEVTALRIVAGNGRSCAVTQGQAGCWGYGGYGALGRGDNYDWGYRPGEMANLVPIPLPSPTLQVYQVATNLFDWDHTCLLFTNMQVSCNACDLAFDRLI